VLVVRTYDTIMCNTTYTIWVVVRTYDTIMCNTTDTICVVVRTYDTIMCNTTYTIWVEVLKRRYMFKWHTLSVALICEHVYMNNG